MGRTPTFEARLLVGLRHRFASRLPQIVTALLIAVFAFWFARLSLDRHAALQSNAEDLGFHTQAVWNTLRGQPFAISLYLDPVVRTDVDPRTLRRPDSLLAFHVEALLLPLSLLFIPWPGAETLLIVQAAGAALGAWPIHRLAVRALTRDTAGALPNGPVDPLGAQASWPAVATLLPGTDEAGRQRTRDDEAGEDACAPRGCPDAGFTRRVFKGRSTELDPSKQRDLTAAWAGLVFAAVYLLAPPLQWALLSDFHPTVLAATALAFLYDFALPGRPSAAPSGRFHRLTTFLRASDAGFWIAGLAALAAREEVALLVAPIAAYRLIRGPRRRAGALLATAAMIWLAVCFLVILPTHGPIASASGGSSAFLNRYAHLGDSPSAIVRTVLTQPDVVAGLIGRPAALHSLFGLVAMTGGLGLLAPLAAASALPILALNLLSAWPWMAAGQAHYSVLIVPPLVAASCLGGSLLARGLRRVRVRGIVPMSRAVIAGWALASALLWTRVDGLTPLNPTYRPPHPTAHDRLIGRFLDQIPPGEPVSATTGVYPHLATRPAAYLYPTIHEATYILIDVTGSSFPTSPGDQFFRIWNLLDRGGFGVIDAADGYLLLRRGDGGKDLPAEFWTFLAPGEPDSTPPSFAGLMPERLRWTIDSDGPTQVAHFSVEWIAGTDPWAGPPPVVRAHQAGVARDLIELAPGYWWTRALYPSPGQRVTITFPPLPLLDLRSIEVGPAGGATRQVVIDPVSTSGEFSLSPAPGGSESGIPGSD